MKVQHESAKLICVETKDSFVLLCEWISSNNQNGLNQKKSNSTDSTMKSGKKSNRFDLCAKLLTYEGVFQFSFWKLESRF